MGKKTYGQKPWNDIYGVLCCEIPHKSDGHHLVADGGHQLRNKNSVRVRVTKNARFYIYHSSILRGNVVVSKHLKIGQKLL